MKWYIFNPLYPVVISILLALLPSGADASASYTGDGAHGADSVAAGPDSARAETHAGRSDAITRYDRRIRRYRRHWAALIPTHTVVQYAGNMGLVSAGIGWEYGKRRQWETEVLFGFLPKYNSDRGKMTMTLKENYIPWHLTFKRGYLLDPLTCGLYVNTVYGPEFWSRQPGRYPDKYYHFLSTKLRINAFLGQRIGIVIPRNRRKYVKNVTLFYEVSTCDLYVRAMFMDQSVKLTDITSLSLGLRLQLF